jgi:hypothetical protein
MLGDACPQENSAPESSCTKSACPQVCLGLGALSHWMKALKCVLYSSVLKNMSSVLSGACPQKIFALECWGRKLPALKRPFDWAPLASR